VIKADPCKNGARTLNVNVRQLQETYISMSRKLYFEFMDLEKPFDRVPREVMK